MAYDELEDREMEMEEYEDKSLYEKPDTFGEKIKDSEEASETEYEAAEEHQPIPGSEPDISEDEFGEKVTRTDELHDKKPGKDEDVEFMDSELEE